VAVDSFPANAAEAYCTQVYACCSATETADAGALGPTRAVCINNLTAQLDGKTGLLKSEQAAGRLMYHPDIASTCVKKLAALKCQDLKVAATATPAECNTYVEPKVAVGRACALSESCVGSWCSGGSVSQDGTCTPFIAEGQSCTSGQCASGTYCDGTHTCVKPKADGAACTTNQECTTGGCNDKNPDGGVGTCGLKGGSGTTCFITQGCSVTGPGMFVLLALALLARRRSPCATAR
jgi:hypothetical protein